MNENDTAEVPYKEIILERLTYAAQTHLSERFAIEPKVSVDYLRPEFRGMTATIRQDILCHKLETVKVKYPRDWWQSFKERWFPEWMLEKCPIEYERKKLEARVLLPKIDIPADQYEMYLHLVEENWYE